MLCAIWYHLHNFKVAKNTHGDVLLLVKLQAEKKVTLHHECFLRFLNCTYGAKSRIASQICMTGHSKTTVIQEVT